MTAQGTTRQFRVVVAGAGISGLAAAHRLIELAGANAVTLEVVLLEASERVGGVIRSRAYGDFLIEQGPDSFITAKPAALELCKRLGLEGHLVPTNSAGRRTFVARAGSLVPLPEGFMMIAPTRWLPFATTEAFSLPGKLRMAMDLVLEAKRDERDETVAQFVTRRLGREALERVAEPMIGGIYTGDAERLSIKATMPRFVDMERKHKSVIRGMLAETGKASLPQASESGARYSMFVTLDDGLQMLADELAARLPAGSLRLGSVVSRVVRNGGAGLWSVVLQSGESIEADALIVALPANHASAVLTEAAPELSNLLSGIELASSAVLNLIYSRKDIPHALDGFGFVVPRTEKRTIIACSFSSVKFPGRAPEGKTILRVFLGGALHASDLDLSDSALTEAACADLRHYLGISAQPLSSTLMRFPQSMPQYNVGHLERLDNIDRQLKEIPGLALAGNAYRGVGLPDCIATGEKAAESLLQWLTAGS